jgi:hypothetical protein
MIGELLRIYEEGRVNPRPPQCIFAETLILNEGWMLRAAIHSLRSVQVPAWLEGRGDAALPFLPFPPGVLAYSEGQLRSPFGKRAQADPLGEGRTRVDGSWARSRSWDVREVQGLHRIAACKHGQSLDYLERLCPTTDRTMWPSVGRPH